MPLIPDGSPLAQGQLGLHKRVPGQPGVYSKTLSPKKIKEQQQNPFVSHLSPTLLIYKLKLHFKVCFVILFICMHVCLPEFTCTSCLHVPTRPEAWNWS